ncbi:MAG: putative quinol monooxygenase [Bacteroidia bacterium]|jgi:quinol monooxygenase YgiN
MLIRMVHMHFASEHVHEFLTVFEKSKELIRAFPGCMHLELLREKDDACSLTTYSHWENADALEAYRQSELFAKTWAATKVLFDKAPRAMSYERVSK